MQIAVHHNDFFFTRLEDLNQGDVIIAVACQNTPDKQLINAVEGRETHRLEWPFHYKEPSNEQKPSAISNDGLERLKFVKTPVIDVGYKGMIENELDVWLKKISSRNLSISCILFLYPVQLDVPSPPMLQHLNQMKIVCEERFKSPSMCVMMLTTIWDGVKTDVLEESKAKFIQESWSQIQWTDSQGVVPQIACLDNMAESAALIFRDLTEAMNIGKVAETNSEGEGEVKPPKLEDADAEERTCRSGNSRVQTITEAEDEDGGKNESKEGSDRKSAGAVVHMASEIDMNMSLQRNISNTSPRVQPSTSILLYRGVSPVQNTPLSHSAPDEETFPLALEGVLIKEVLDYLILEAATLVEKTGRDDVQLLTNYLDSVLGSEDLAAKDRRNRILTLISRIAVYSHIYPQRCILQPIKYDLEPIMAGGTGDIHQAMNETICIKVAQRTDDRTLTSYFKELVLWSHTSHPNILPFFGMFFSGPSQRICLVSPWMKKGNLTIYTASLPQKDRMPLLSDVVDGLAYLHDMGIVHSNIKGDNVLVSAERRALITDFGSSHITTNTMEQEKTRSIIAHTPCFSAPEVLEQMLTGSTVRPKQACDIWSLGCLLYEILTRKVPFYGLNIYRIRRTLCDERGLPRRPKEGEIDCEEVDDEIWALMLVCWVFDPRYRPDCQIIRRMFAKYRVSDDRPNPEPVEKPEGIKIKSNVDIDIVRVERLLRELNCRKIPRDIRESGGWSLLMNVRQRFGQLSIRKKKRFSPDAQLPPHSSAAASCEPRSNATSDNDVGNEAASLTRNSSGQRPDLNLISPEDVGQQSEIARPDCQELQPMMVPLVGFEDRPPPKQIEKPQAELSIKNDLVHEKQVLHETSFQPVEPRSSPKDPPAFSLMTFPPPSPETLPTSSSEIFAPSLCDLTGVTTKDVLDHLIKEAPILVGKIGSDSVQLLTNYLDLILGKDTLIGTDWQNRIFTLLSRIAVYAGVYPQRHILQPVEYGSSPVADGGFGTVYQTLDHAVAVKVMKGTNEVMKGTNDKAFKSSVKELIVWSHLSHPNILPFFGIFFSLSDQRMCLVSPWMKNGNLSRYTAGLTQKDRMPLLLDVADGLVYLHQLGIVHSDIKGQNVLVSDERRALLTDFGTSHIITSSMKRGTTQSVIAFSVNFTAPEVLQQSSSRTRPKKSCDIWSFGCLCFEILTGRIPFHGLPDFRICYIVCNEKGHPTRPGIKQEVTKDDDEDSDEISDEEIDDSEEIDDEIWALMIACWEFDPQKRPKCHDIQELMADMVISDNRPAPRAVGKPHGVKPASEPKVDLDRVRKILSEVQATIQHPL